MTIRSQLSPQLSHILQSILVIITTAYVCGKILLKFSRICQRFGVRCDPTPKKYTFYVLFEYIWLQNWLSNRIAIYSNWIYNQFFQSMINSIEFHRCLVNDFRSRKLLKICPQICFSNYLTVGLVFPFVSFFLIFFFFQCLYQSSA